ncbi:MAG: M24 family metallopeptidase [Bacteriovoracaceae bacterium]|jgi:Xaa-Pro aminopeptidase|nr:M24 family metallopeptidase [Bacteriovoracaceae bacterium]
MAKKQTLDNTQVGQNIKTLQALMNENNLEYFYISSFDEYLNEYVPMNDCRRFYLTSFSGSVAEVLVPASGKVKLYVDGRYHEQADLEVDLSLVEVVKVPQNKSLAANLLEDLPADKSLGYEAKRTSLKMYKELSKNNDVTAISLDSSISMDGKLSENPVRFIEKEFRGNDTKEKLANIFSATKEDAYFVTAIDSLAWITNCRGYHLPNLSSFLGTALVTKNKVYAFVNPSINLDDSVSKNTDAVFIKTDDLESELSKLKSSENIKSVIIDGSMLNADLFITLKNCFGEDNLKNVPGGLVSFHSLKDEGEIKEIKRSFNLGDTAIYNTIKWVKNSVANGTQISELDLYKQTTIEYQKQTALEQSFNTIAGVGPNGSIIHYGDPKEDVKIKADDMVLLDSGGYFDGGFATDTTRTFMASSEEPTAKHKEIYTLTLKGMLQCQHAVFPEGTPGIVLDGYARKPIYDAGMDFMHGTGHGIGVHVHEGGVRIGKSNLPMKEGQVVSIEPGIYIPGFGGVRLENIAHVVKAEDKPGFLRFDPLVYIGFEPSLIEESMLTKDELTWLNEYENKCSELGRSFR